MRSAVAVFHVPAHKAADDGIGGILQQFLRGRHLHDLALVHKHDHVGQLQGLLHIVGNKDDGLFQLFLEPADFLLQAVPGDGVQRAEGLIHQHYGRRGRQRPQHADALLLTAGKLRGIFPGILLIGHIHQRQQVPHGLLPLLPGVLQKLGHHRDILLHRHIGKQPDLLDHIADAAAQLNRVLLGNVLSAHQDGPCVRLDQPVYHL
ncbi:hypothetical protein SDC9_71983 [bioreactor metagenome]|uniref:Uncharacterized protein n=1 Tax=bioreactor metagenome TaxID=1076179 RepID=A0A644YC15_9ZZZZ